MNARVSYIVQFLVVGIVGSFFACSMPIGYRLVFSNKLPQYSTLQRYSLFSIQYFSLHLSVTVVHQYATTLQLRRCVYVAAAVYRVSQPYWNQDVRDQLIDPIYNVHVLQTVQVVHAADEDGSKSFSLFFFFVIII